MLQDLKKFLMRGNVVDLAVAVVIGAAFNAVVKAFEALQERRANQEVPEEETPAPSDEVILLGEIRDLLRAQQQ